MEQLRQETRTTVGITSRLEQPAWYWAIAVLLVGFYVATSLYIASRRPLWLDEIFTAICTRRPDLGTLWKLLSESAEQVPVGYFLITRPFDQWFHHADFALRVPSALALGVGMGVIFDTVRRLTNGLYGLIALSFLGTSLATYYGYEARPYSLCFMLAAVILWQWIFTNDDSIGAACAFGTMFFVGVTIHYYFLFCLTPFGLFALAHRRVFHPKVVAAVAGIAAALAVLYPQVAASRSLVSGSFVSWAEPSMKGLYSVYLEFFPLALFPLVLIVTGVAFAGRSRQRVVQAMGAGERVGWLFLTIPIVVYIVARLVTHFFYNRYMIGTIPGVVVAVSCLCFRYCREAKYLSLALLVILGAFGIKQQLFAVGNTAHIPAFGDPAERSGAMISLEDSLLRDGKRQITVAAGPGANLLFLESWYYSKHPELYSMVSGVWGLSHYVPLHNQTFEGVVANARQTALVNPTPEFIEALEHAGLHVKTRFARPLHVVYLE